MVLPSELPKGLIYVKANSPGFTRKPKGDQFHYFDKSGNRIKEAKDLKRIEEIVIPPAWSDVWISPKANTYL